MGRCLQVGTHLRGGHVVQHWWAAWRASPIQLSKQVLGGQVAGAQLHRPIRDTAGPARSSHWARDQHCVLENGRRGQQLFYCVIKKAFDRPMAGEDFKLKQEKRVKLLPTCAASICSSLRRVCRPEFNLFRQKRATVWQNPNRHCLRRALPPQGRCYLGQNIAQWSGSYDIELGEVQKMHKMVANKCGDV